MPTAALSSKLPRVPPALSITIQTRSHGGQAPSALGLVLGAGARIPFVKRHTGKSVIDP